MGTFKFILFSLAACVSLSVHAADQLAARPNVVLIVCDDLNDYVTGFGGHPQARTPNMARLAQSGVAFQCAYSNNPVCAPSRSSFLTGIYPHTSGNFFWTKWFQNPVLKNSKTIMEHFRDNGYHVAGSGKLMHHGKPEVWSEFKHPADYGPVVFDGTDRVAHPSVPLPFGKIGAIDGSFAPLSDVPFADDDDPNSGWLYGDWRKQQAFRYTSEDDRDPTPDERNATWAAGKIDEFAAQTRGKPFFLGVGFIRPHTPLHVPKKYFDMFPLQDVALPVIQRDDAADTHYAKVFPSDQKGLRYFRDLADSYPTTDEGIRSFTRAYLACVSAVDDCIGQVVDAIDNSPPSIRDNTIIVVTSDHGWNMGQKGYLFKNSPWEESTRVPFIIRAPGVAKAGSVCQQPISLIDLYPTLVDLCSLEGDTRKNKNGAKLDGHSIRSFLTDPEDGSWDGPDAALSMIFVGQQATKQGLSKEDVWNVGSQNWSIRTAHWRYIRYRTGAEELYDHRTDPREWTNLADDPKYTTQKQEMIERLHSMVPALITK